MSDVPNVKDLMKEVKAGFGRTMSHLPAVFGVSRQTLYNWLSGEVPKEQHQGKLVQLAAAAHVFAETGFKPTPQALDRTVAQGKSFVELIGEGSDGKETAQRLVRIVKRGAVSRGKLDALLGDRKSPRLDVSDMGRCEYCGRLQEMSTFGFSCPHCEPPDDINELKRLVARYEFALTKIAHLDFVITLPDRMDAVREIAREALNE